MRDIIIFLLKKMILYLIILQVAKVLYSAAHYATDLLLDLICQKQYKEIYQKANKALDLQEQTFICGDSLDLLQNDNFM